MKKGIKILFFLSLCLLNMVVFAQGKDPRAKKILDEVKEKYKVMKAFRAYFTYTLSSPTAGVTESFSGDITVKGNKFYLILPKQEIINNGNTSWTYLKDANEVNIQDAEKEEKGSVTPNRIYNLYESGYDYAYVEDKTENGITYEIVDLKPLDKNEKFFKIRLKIVKSSKSIKSWEIFEKNANRYLYLIDRFATVTVSDNYFKFNSAKYPNNPEIIDLR